MTTTATETRTLTMTKPEVQVHLVFREPVKVTIKGQPMRARSATFPIRDGKPGRVLANVDTPDGISALRNAEFTDLPAEIQAEVRNEFETTMAFAAQGVIA